ncbi:Succinyl-diaminopimelate desuccinylase [Rubripirellula obstinata]|uniref:Succinyl-diaminopimelate desuccinylase n=2 Tax=Rubripirellula obstinata TaxID=406547 RepID=A0A5B1CFV5_9BACT|nr:Succinyl-diaminopimelate desuccinylase [Rubripirellula obstinata]
MAQSLQQSQQRHLDELIQWLKIPSVSSDTSKIGDVKAAGDWIANKLADSGLKVETIQTQGHPMIYAESPAIDGAPVVLVYGHYDVQPPEPLNLWTTPAFEPTVRNGNLYARGATDDKGQVLTHVHSICDWMATGKPLPLQIKLLIEGEEEVGSENLERMMPELADKLACDCVVISDSSQYGPGQPAITYGLRGIATYELLVQGPKQDLHSGSFGGAVMNPAIALCHLMSSMVDREGRIAIDGFYDSVRDLSPAEREAWDQLPKTDDFAKSVGASELFGEKGYSADERRWARPTFDINGLTSGHQGEGVKTVLPAQASAKFSFRLVPDQDPTQLTDAINSHLTKHLPTGVTFKLTPDHGAPGMLADTNSRFMDAARAAITAAFETPPVLIREGGSIPIVTRFQETLRCDCLLLGWGLSDDNAHSPDEKFCIEDFYRGIQASTMLWESIGKLSS